MAFVWEKIVEGGREWTLRAKVPGGWLVKVIVGNGIALTFYPDPNYVWDGSTLP